MSTALLGPQHPARRQFLRGWGLAPLATLGGALPHPTAQAAPTPRSDEALALWSLTLEQPDGRPLVLSRWRDRPLLVNFWASWCGPCVREMPLLSGWAQAQQGRVAVLGLAVDAPTPVREFLARRPVGFPIGLAGLQGTELMRVLGNTRGGLPFSLLLNAQGRIVRRKLGELHENDLLAWQLLASSS